MKQCFVIVSPSDEDFGRLITELEHPENWRQWTVGEFDVFLAGSEAIFNEYVHKQLAQYAEVYVALHPHPTSPQPLTISKNMRVKSFSHITKNPIWAYGQSLVDQLWNLSERKPANLKKAEEDVRFICTLILDRETLFLEHALRCLHSIYEEMLKPTPTINAVKDAIGNNLRRTFLENLKIERKENTKIESWLVKLSSYSNAELDKVSLDIRIESVRELRDILLGTDDGEADGILHFLKVGTRGPIST